MKILIVGSGPDWEKAPFDDESYTVWTYGLIAHVLPRVDVVFEMHRRDTWARFNHSVTPEEYTARLIGLKKLIYMCKHEADIQHSLAYPLEHVEELVGPHFASSLSYQLGLACLHQKRLGTVEEIALFGFDMTHWEEWAYQRPNANRLIGFAQGLGIKITLSPASHLVGVPWKYGYEVDDEEIHVTKALIDEDYAQLAALMSRISDHQLALSYARRKTREGAPVAPAKEPLSTIGGPNHV